MQENKMRSVDIADCDEQTFIRFSQYAYTGDYVAATSEILLSSSDIDTANMGNTGVNGKETADTTSGGVFTPTDLFALVAPAPQEVEPTPEVQDDQWGSFTKKTMKKKKKSVMPDLPEPCTNGCEAHCVKPSTAARIWQTFLDRHYSITSPIFKARGNSEACENFIEVFLCHARLFVFADKYLITALTGLCLHKLHQTLIAFHLYDERAGDVVELLRYAYSGEGWGNLQALVVHYAACVIRKLQKNEDFVALLGERSSLSADLIDRLLSDGCLNF